MQEFRFSWIKLALRRYTLQSLLKQFPDLQLFIANSNTCRLFLFFNLSGKTLIFSIWWYSVLTTDTKKLGVMCQISMRSFTSNISVIAGRERPFLALYISIMRIWRFLVWIKAKPSFSNSSSDNDCLSEYIICKQLSWSLFTLLLLVRLWHVHTRIVVFWDIYMWMVLI